MLDQGMAEIGDAARQGQPPSDATLQRIVTVARISPLAPEPFLVHGALAQLQSRMALAERLFVEARFRNPRSPAARYFLAERYLRTGRTREALIEMAVMSRLVRGAGNQFAPALAAFAHQPGAVPQLRELFQAAPDYRDILLGELAKDARNADLILRLAGTAPIPAAGAPAWQSELIGRLIDAGEYRKAYAVWGRLTGANAAPSAIFNPRFAALPSPPPFNWRFASGGGVADPMAGGRLQIIYFGRTDAILAEQFLLLAPGAYRLRMRVSGTVEKGNGVSWTVTCLKPVSTLLRLPIERAGAIEANFIVPASCEAQKLQLAGTPAELGRSAEMTISALQLIRVSGR